VVEPVYTGIACDMPAREGDLGRRVATYDTFEAGPACVPPGVVASAKGAQSLLALDAHDGRRCFADGARGGTHMVIGDILMALDAIKHFEKKC
jgi:hypothetical protein